ncbi:DUF899 family protein [Micromonospora sp. NPDC007271]|uniref:DUF899 family protein n=1 Tax=Micromonospora sp. NPDC007271 TaxID=3154587 RepID=UPI0033EA40BE
MANEQLMWPEGTKEDYITARRALLTAERDLRDAAERLAALRRALPDGAELPDVLLTEGPAALGDDGPVRRTQLSALFGEHSSLFVYHLMHTPADGFCPMCSMWLDGLNGVAAHIEENAALAVIAPAPIAEIRQWARTRGWPRLRLLSCAGTTFTADLNIDGPDGTVPAVSVLTRDGSTVRHFYTAHAIFPDGTGRGMDLLSPVWNVLDLLPQGRRDWYPANRTVGDDCCH